MSLENGLGAINSNKNIEIVKKANEKIAIIKLPTSESFWVVIQLN